MAFFDIFSTGTEYSYELDADFDTITHPDGISIAASEATDAHQDSDWAS